MPVGIGLAIAGVGSIAGAAIGSSGAKSAAKTQASAATQAATLQITGSTEAAKMQSDAARYAADAQAKAASDATGLQRDIFNQNQTNLAPWLSAGKGALSMLADATGINGPEGYSRSTDAFKTSPGYDFAFDQGTRAVNSNMAARGMLRSGASLKALTQFGQGTANQEYGAFTNRLSSLAGLGQTANAYSQQSGQAYANNAGNTMQDAAAARASGYIGAANAGAYGLMGAANAGASGLIGAANAGAAGILGSNNAYAGGFGQLSQLAGYGAQNGWFGNSGGGNFASYNPGAATWYPGPNGFNPQDF